jgi:hypothetical protein
MKIRLHEPDPLEVSVGQDPPEGCPFEVTPVFYGRSRSCVLFPISTVTDGGKVLHNYRLKVTDTGKLVLEELGQPRVLDVDKTEPTTHKLR